MKNEREGVLPFFIFRFSFFVGPPPITFVWR
jgi:hypothetical protein